MEEIIGNTGPGVDLLNKNLTQEEWNALCIVHRMSNRLDIGIRFDFERSVDITFHLNFENGSQIVDESVYLSKEDTKAYALECSAGSFDSHSSWIGGVFLDKKDAEAEVIRLTTEARKIVDACPIKGNSEEFSDKEDEDYTRYWAKHQKAFEWSIPEIKEIEINKPYYKFKDYG
jgi:hypothetical protein